MSTSVRVAGRADLPFLTEHDPHVARPELGEVVARGRVLLAEHPDEPAPVGWLRWGLFWDQVPFMNLLVVVAAHRGRGVGRLLVGEWERGCGATGFAMVLTSTVADEQAQHFYRHLGYLDAGALQLPDEAPELLFRKSLPSVSSEQASTPPVPI